MYFVILLLQKNFDDFMCLTAIEKIVANSGEFYDTLVAEWEPQDAAYLPNID